MWKALPLVLLALPGLASAADNCKFHADRSLSLNLAGVRSVVIETGPYDFHVKAGSSARASGRACASSQDMLDRLQLIQRREGDRLIVAVGSDRNSWSGNWLRGNYASFDVNVTLPRAMPLEMAVGSGDADVAGIANVDSHVGSGDLSVRGADRLEARIGSGDIKADDIGRLEIDVVGSGDFEATNIRGDVRIGSIGSGGVDLRRVGGSVEASSIGSGDLSVATVGGGLRVRSVGSGSVDHDDVKGRVDVPSDD